MIVWRGAASCAVACTVLLLIQAASPTALGQDNGDCAPANAGYVTCLIPLAEDTLFFLENRGVTRIHVDLNGNRFKLASDPQEVQQSVNAFLIPLHGSLTVDISAYMVPGFDTNEVSFLTQGSPEADWRFVIAPVFVEDQTEVAYAITGLEPFPTSSGLRGSYPNPFRSATTIPLYVSEDRLTGLDFTLSIYDVRGRLVRRLVDDTRFPGAYEFIWDGRDDAGQEAASGVYVARLRSERYVESFRLVRIR